MSSETTDYSLIHDEDALKRMWEDTDDFGRKKEIRAHMYKIREARLRDFYTNTGESETIKTTKSSSEKITHADSLGDQSFLSLKTKEIRDSESPTRDAYKITGVTRKQDHGWDIIETNQSSDDGKHKLSTRLATTSGKKDIKGGEANFAAKSEQKASVFEDGDDKNFRKAVGSSSHNVVKQEAHGGDENSKFYSSSTTESSSSQYRSEHKSTSGDFEDKLGKSIEFQSEKIPKDFKSTDGKTKVFTETKTLPDGSTVTTTRYETVGSKSYSTSEKRSQQSSKSSNVHVENIEVPSQEVTTVISNQKYIDEDHSRRLQDLKTLGRDTDSNVKITRTTKTETTSKPTTETKVIETSERVVSEDVQQKKTDNIKTTNYERGITNKFDDQKISADNFITIERQHVVETNQKPVPTEIIEIDEVHRKKTKEAPKYETVERREPFKPPKSEMDEKKSPTEGQYETTYRTDYVTKKICVEVSPTHDAFARSLRSVSPDRNRIGSAKSSRTPSQSSLRSSPEKARSPEKYKKSKSPDKFSSTETFTKNVIRRRSEKSEIDSSTLTRKKKPSRSPSPTTTASEIEYVRSVHDVTTDLDTQDAIFKDTKITRRHTEDIVMDKRPKTLEVTNTTTTKKKKVTERSPTSPLTDFSPKKTTPTNETKVPDDRKKSLRRTDTYEERCKEILGLIQKERKKSPEKSPVKKSPEKEPLEPYPEKPKQPKEPSKISEFPSQIRKSPQKEPKELQSRKTPEKEDYPKKTTLVQKRIKTEDDIYSKEGISSFLEVEINETERQLQVEKTKKPKEPSKIPEFQVPHPKGVKEPTKPSKISEFPSQVRKSPEKEPLSEYPEKPKQSKKEVVPQITQITRSPNKETFEPYPEKTKEPKEPSKISEFSSKIRKTHEEEHLEENVEVTKISKKEPYLKQNKKDAAPQICEFPSQIRKSPEKEALEPYPEKKKEPKEPSKISEFPSQIRKTHEEEHLEENVEITKISKKEPYPKQNKKDAAPQICEFPSQIRKSPEKEALEPYPEKKKSPKEPSKILEFPSQIRKTHEEEHLEENVEITKISKKEPYTKQNRKDAAPQICEFPSQIRKSPEKEALEPYPEKKKEPKEPSKISEFPSQIRKTYEDEYLEENVEKSKISRKETYSKEPKKPSKISEVPSTRQTYDREDIEEIVDKTKITKKIPKEPKVSEKPKQSKKDTSPQICEFPSQIRKSPEKEPLEPYPEKIKEPKVPSKISEFPSQTRKSPQKDYMEYPSDTPKRIIKEKSPDRISLDDIPVLRTDRRTPDRVSLSDLEIRKESELDSFMKKERVDTEITLKKYDQKSKKTNKKETVKIEESDSSEDEMDDVKKTIEIHVDIRDTSVPIEMREVDVVHEKTKIATKKIDQNKKREKIEVRKVQNLESKKPVKEVMVPKKIQPLCEDTKVKVTGKDKSRGIPDVHHRVVKKDQPEKMLPTKTKTPNKVETTPKSRVVTTTKITITPVLTTKIDSSTKKVEKKIPRIAPQKPAAPSGTKLTKTTLQKTIEAVPSNRHVVSTIINLKPKTNNLKTIHKTTVTKNVISPSTIAPTRPKSKITPSRVISKPDHKKKPTLTNGHLPSDEEETDQEIETIEKTKKQSKKQEKKCITTKSILIENAVADEREIIVDLKRSKSSREGTPDRICPYPVTIEDSTMPRYPDKITEPEESAKTKKITTDIIHEDTEGFDSKISEVLTVNEKVSRFLTTAEEVTRPKEKAIPAKVEREIFEVDDNLQEDDCLLSVSDKVTKFITTAEELTKPKATKSPLAKEEVEVKVEENDESLLSVSEKVSHFIATAEKVKKPQVTKAERTPSPEKIKERSPSPKKEQYLKREESFKKQQTVKKEEKEIRRDSLDIETTPKTSRRSSKDEPKTVLSPTGRLRSTETIKKAKALFENISKEQEATKQRDILNRQAIFDVKKKEWKPTESEHEEIPHYMTPLDRTVKESKPKEKQPSDKDEEEEEIVETQEIIEEDLPHYMLPLDRTLRERSPHKESVKQIEDIMTRSTSSTYQVEETDTRTTKFGVTLRRTDSGRMVTVQKLGVEKQEEINVEEIFDLEYLEKLLKTIVGYDIRRRIRAQIRVVKKMIEEGRIEIRREISKKTTKSPIREVSEKRRSSSIEHQQKISSTSTHTYVEEETKRSRRSKSPTEKTRKSPEKVETKRVFQTELKKTKPVQKKPVEEKPEWVTQKTLKKVSDGPIKRSTVTTTVKKTTTSRSEKSPSKEFTDVITSSYGVGPLDENGTPLFGLKALRAQNKSEKTKVQGTVIQSQYYSENGQEPIGEISVTKYSTDPKDLESSEFKTEKGLSSVTTTQKFGYKGTPSLKTISGKTKALEEEQSSTKTTKVTRRGSVKEISQKFIENAVDTLKSERKTSFPKAGLILRTSSFKEKSGSQSPKSASSREASPGYETRTSVRTVKTAANRVDTFLSNKSKITDVQDVITRMKNEEVEGDSIEDIEAKNLLNKFIGSQVLLSGMESIQDGGKRTVTKITTSVSESGQPAKTITRTFTHPITPDLLKTVWDQQTLNLLLEQSTDYEDRRIIRNRLKEIMAEQEACADLVERAAEDVREDSRTSTIHGESLLLPLLQGLLDKPDGDQPADSGTESGEDLRSGLILEVQTALDKLSASLKNPATSVSEERRNSLLQLVCRLQQGLSSQLTPSSSSERRSSFQGSRFLKKKQNRQSRHTVGVTSDELEDARRLMDEINGGIEKESVKVKNLTAKPFVSSNATSQSQSGTSSTVDTPTETSESIDFLGSSNSDILEKEIRTLPKRRTLSENAALDFDLASIEKAVKDAATNKINNQTKNVGSDTDDDPSTVKNAEKQPKPDLIMQTNPAYRPNDQESDDEFNSNYTEKANRFNTKKLKMKRANTIDIPKPLKYYEYDEEESENEDLQTRRNSYLALRGPIHVGKFNVSKKVPQFEAKTDNDKKFLAFISKKDAATPVKAPWVKQPTAKNNFAKIKNCFEKQNPAGSVNSARNFWKSADDAAITAGKQKSFGPKISRQSARNLQQMFEEKQRQSQHEKENWEDKNVVTGSLRTNLKVIAQPNPVNQFSHNPTMSAFKPVRPQQKSSEKGAVFLYSPKPFSPENSPQSSPVSSTPWSPKSSESRVLSIAASKFENNQKLNFSERKPAVSNKIVIPPALKRQESLTSPHIVKNLNQNNSVRKLSGQYDNLINKVFVPGENYTIQYDQKPNIYNAEYTITQKINFPISDEVQHNLKQLSFSQKMQESEKPDFLKDTIEDQATYWNQPYQKYQHNEDPQQFTSTCEFKPKISDEKQVSDETLQEYTAINSRVMTGPVNQAVVIHGNSPKSREQHDFDQAFNLRNTLQKLSQNQQPKGVVVYNNVSSPPKKPIVCLNDKPMESLEINEHGETILTSKFHIQVNPDLGGHALSKSESWHQVKDVLANKPSPRASPNSRMVTRSKSSHSLAVPKQYEAGMSKQEMAEKQKSLQAYFGTKQQQKETSKKSSINRTKTSQKVSTQRQNSNSSLSRSQTLPDVIRLDRLDDADIDEVFEEIFKSKRTFTQGPVTTTSHMTSRMTTQQQVTKKPMSPFAKFRQLDKQNSLNSPPSTPKTPTGSGSFFKFTDPALSQSANTVKQRLLQWCQRKTMGYENVQLENFSTSWADGMAFCALIHHFLPEAFDYDALSPRNRRQNFTLAFRIAEDKAGIAPLLDVDDMVAISKPDWKCVFTYVQSIYRRFKDED